MSALTFTPGKFYKTRDGRKYECLKTGLRFSAQDTGMAGLVCNRDGTVEIRCHHGDGKYISGSEHNLDLIAEWKDAPEVDWSKMPAWAVAVTATMDLKRWAWWKVVPTLQEPSFGWAVPRGYVDSDPWGTIPPEFAPKWSGDWRDSLVTRPTEGPQP